MKHTFHLFSLAVILALLTSSLGWAAAPARAATVWEAIGAAGFSSATAGSSSLAIDHGTPYVAYVDADNASKASVMKYDAVLGSWVAVEALGFSVDSIDQPHLLVDNDVPYVAYQDWGNSGKATVMKFDGSAWVPVGTPGFSAGQAVSISLAIDNNTLYVAYKDWANSGKATVMKFDGSAWVPVGTPGFSAGRAEVPVLAIDNGMLYVAYQDWGNSGKATVMKFNGAAWTAVGVPGFTTKTATDLSFAVDHGTPYVAYQDGDHAYKATVLKFDGSAWVPVGTPGFSAGVAGYLSLAVENGLIYVAYKDDAASFGDTVMKFDATSRNWLMIGPAGFSAGRADYTLLAFEHGILYTAYQDWANDMKVTVMKFEYDTTPPEAPIVTSPPALIADTHPMIQGTAEPNSLVNVWYWDDSNNRVQICQDSAADGSGNWSCELSTELPEREIELAANATDEVGNTSPDTSYSFTIDLTTWEILGTPGFSTEAVWFTSLALDHGTPYVAYRDWDTGDKATVMKFDAHAGEWVAVGLPGFSLGPASFPSIALNNGTPYVAYVDTDEYSTVTVMKYDADSGNWAIVGPMSFSPHYVNALAFTIDNGTPYVAYTSQTNGYRATVMKFDADVENWVTVGAAGFSGGEADSISLAVEDGTPFVAYADYSDGSGQATVMRYDGDSGNWITVGPSRFSTAEAADISLAVNTSTPYVGYKDLGNQGKATVMKFDAVSGSWVGLGTPGFTPGSVSNPSLVFEDGIPCLALEDEADKGRASVMKFDGLAWTTVGAADFSADHIDGLSLAVDRGVPYVAYKDLGNSGKATVMRLRDKIAPAAPVVTEPAALINDATPSISGTAEPESFINVRYFDTGQNPVTICQDVPVDGSGDWSCVSSISLPEREIELAVHATDSSGNSSVDTSYFFTLDLTIPSKPVVDMPKESTSDDTPTLGGMAEPQSLIQVSYWDGAGWVSACQNSYADQNGNWSCIVSQILPAGRITLAVIATDPAGNQSLTTSHSFTVTQSSYGEPTVDVYIHGEAKGHHTLSPAAGARQSYKTNNGPVKIVSTKTLALTASERVIYKANNVPASFSELLALPDRQLDKVYWLPWYNNRDLDTQLRFGNVTDQTATVHIYVNGKEVKSGCTAPNSPYTLEPGASLRISCTDMNNGPVKIESDVDIVAAERVIYKVGNAGTSFSEMMALPNKQLDNTYWLPWYNNVDLDTQLRFGNVDPNLDATVHLFIGGQEMTTQCLPNAPYTLKPGESMRVSCAGLNNGPVQIKSNTNIVAAERVIYKVNGVNTSFSEMMALPNSQLDNTYWLPWYNNRDLDTQLRFGNVDPFHTATVHVYVGGVEVSSCSPHGSPFLLKPGESARVSCAGLNNGPVQIESDVPIVAAERVIYKVNNVGTSFSEMLALPNSQLDTTYWLPWYNNVDLDTQLRFGVP